MIDEKKSDNTKTRTTPGRLIALGCMWVVVAMISPKGLVQWMFYAVAIGTFFRAFFNAKKITIKNNGQP